MSNFHQIDAHGTPETTATYAYHSNPTPIAPNLVLSPAPQHQSYPSLQEGTPHQQYYSQHPQSAGNTPGFSGGNAQDGGQNDPKRSRACEACRGLKVRCDTNPDDPDGPCKRCSKANRNCVVTAPTRKRQKKTDSRVAALEKRIDELSQSLKATKPESPSMGHGSEMVAQNQGSYGSNNSYTQVTNGGYGSLSVPRPNANHLGANDWNGYTKQPSEYDTKKPIPPPMVVAGQKRRHPESRELLPDNRLSQAGPGKANREVQSFGIGDTVLPQQKTPSPNEYADVIDRGLITADMGAQIFTCYVERMTRHMPAVVFPPGTTAAEVRKNRPILFLAILAAAAGMNHPEQQRTLTKEVMNIYADRVIRNGEKTLEIVQALHISTLWYWPPEHFEELKFYQLIHIAAVMALDIGLGRRVKSKDKKAGLWRDNPWRRTPYPDPESVESRRTWLACYFLCCNASMGLRRPNLIRWSSFMADSVDVLETSPDAEPSDKTLCQWVRSQHIAEDIGTQFSMDDPVANVSISDKKVQYALKNFESNLASWKESVPEEVLARSATLEMAYHVINLYMHEVAMHVDHNVDEFKPPFNEASLRGAGQKPEPLTTAHVDALSTCLNSIDGTFKAFLTLNAETIRCLPVAHFVRIAYAVVMLIKIYFVAATPSSEIGALINKENMKVEQHLNGLVNAFGAAAAEEKSRPASKFLMVLTALKIWFHRQKDGKGNTQLVPSPMSTMTEPKNDSEGKTRKPEEKSQQSKTQIYGPANTPLQLLSEVATGNQGNSPNTPATGPLPATLKEWSTPQQQYPNLDPALMTPSGYNNMAMGNIDPSLSGDLGFQIGDGFEQAMGLGGVADFGNYFSDDAFFNNIMDSVGGGSGFDGF